MVGWVGLECAARRFGVDITAGYDTPQQVQALVGGVGSMYRMHEAYMFS